MEVAEMLADSLMRVFMFVIVQALVYLILSKSSNIFSTTNKMRSFSFRRARSVSIRRMLAAVSDLPQGVEPSPTLASSASLLRSPTQEFPEEPEIK
ncbi:putative Peroxidase superfamily protein [Hibiscus syriacus]|uniref:Peroxidase superfamily protein n=1 Tax=Hibiscus syriacus TaxID=106335 RepID=A0A6A2Z0G2_HIBSY|nr:putative Peroxidase superfamily protein [Hibiscus syriacus]